MCSAYPIWDYEREVCLYVYVLILLLLIKSENIYRSDNVHFIHFILKYLYDEYFKMSKNYCCSNYFQLCLIIVLYTYSRKAKAI